MKASLSKIKKEAEIYLFIVPAVVGLALFRGFPVVFSLVLSLSDWVPGIGIEKFVGLTNYQKLFHDPFFWNALRNTLVYTMGVVPAQVGLSLVMAVLLNAKKIKFRNLFKVSFFFPIISSVVVVAVIWKCFYNPEFGIFNYILSKFLHLPEQLWLSSPDSALFSIMVMNIWRWAGYFMIILFAGLQQISPYFYEAADIDGATAWSKFVYITIPLLRPMLLFVSIISFIEAFKIFDEIYIMTRGGPAKSTETLVVYIYKQGFMFYHFSYASAISYVFFAILFLISILQMNMLSSRTGI